MVTGKAGSKALAHAERMFSAKRITNASAKAKVLRHLKISDKAIRGSYESALKDMERARMAANKARTPEARKKAKARIILTNSRLDELSARKRKVNALARRVNGL